VKILRILVLASLAVTLLVITLGCSFDAQPIDSHEGTSAATINESPDAPQVPKEQEDVTKTIYVYPQIGVSDATVNGNPVITGQDNIIQIVANEPVLVKYYYVNLQGSLTEVTPNLDTYYSFFVLKNNGRYSADTFKSTYESEKTRN